MRAKKSLGQHFLTSPRTAERIARAVDPSAQTIVEIGPGKGILTQYLADRPGRLILVEKDDDLASGMIAEYADRDNISVVHDDVLRVDFRLLTTDPMTSLVGNFPYNISSQIVFQMLDHQFLFARIVGMFQLEMAQRIIAGPGSKAYGVISVLTQTAYTGELLFQVSPGQFNPPPKVKSAVIRLRRKEGFVLPCDYKTLRTVVKMVFQQRRKMLRNTLKPLLPDDILQGSQLFTRRPEQLSLEEFYNIANRVTEFRDKYKS